MKNAAERTTYRPMEWMGLMLALAFAIAYKCTDALSTPQFWAEDATVFFKDQWGRDSPPLMTPYAGYLLVIPRIIAWLGAWLSPANAPLVYNASAIALAATAIAYTCWRLRRHIPTPVVILSFLAVPSSGEIFGTLTNVQWFLQFAMAACCLLPSNAPPSTMAGAWRAILVLLIALTGPFSVLLCAVVGMLLIAGWISRLSGLDPFDGALSTFSRTRDWRALSAMAVGAVVQAWHMVGQAQPHQGMPQPLMPTLELTFSQLFAAHTFGQDFLTRTTWLAIHGALVLTLILHRRLDGGSRLVLTGFITFAAVETILPALRMQDITLMFPLAAADRYFYLAKVVWWWAVWLALSGNKHRTRLNATLATSAMICLVAVTNVQYMRRQAFVDLNWKQHAARLSAPGIHTIPINPQGWTVTLETTAPNDDEH